MDIVAMQEEVYRWASEKGWEPDPGRTFGDECALLHSEISEALEAYRRWRLEDATRAAHDMSDGAFLPTGPVKPEGVGSELADVLIRLCHYSACGRFVLRTLDARAAIFNESWSFGDWISKMHVQVSEAYAGVEFPADRYAAIVNTRMTYLVNLMLAFCIQNGINLEVEYRRKMDYNMTRAYRHGNRVM